MVGAESRANAHRQIFDVDKVLRHYRLDIMHGGQTAGAQRVIFMEV